MPKDKARSSSGQSLAANDNGPASDPAEIDAAVDAALTRIAAAIGRHIAREHIRAFDAANDNEPEKRS